MKIFFPSILCLFTLALSFESYGALVWDWELNSSNLIVGPNDSIVLYASLINSPDSTVVMQNLDHPLLTSYLAIQGDFTSDIYSFSWGPNNDNDFKSQFSGLSLSPGDTFDFIVGTYNPISGGAAPGTYSTPAIALSFMGAGFIDNSFTATVVPIPGAFALFISALGAVGIGSRLTKQARRTR